MSVQKSRIRHSLINRSIQIVRNVTQCKDALHDNRRNLESLQTKAGAERLFEKKILLFESVAGCFRILQMIQQYRMEARLNDYITSFDLKH